MRSITEARKHFKKLYNSGFMSYMDWITLEYELAGIMQFKKRL